MLGFCSSFANFPASSFFAPLLLYSAPPPPPPAFHLPLRTSELQRVELSILFVEGFLSRGCPTTRTTHASQCFSGAEKHEKIIKNRILFYYVLAKVKTNHQVLSVCTCVFLTNKLDYSANLQTYFFHFSFLENKVTNQRIPPSIFSANEFLLSMHA